uniref:Photosystem I reaction center subunit VIII n=1 Tax=Phaeomonas parva TaxID=124430 RepID=A0A7S1U023_9STRA|mmetsp:Transcript_25202/g.79072  ORF Transcript_25202/g.79072 Transcript_25202/m.79072 type:complete len:126 (+) Transcript_25202:183-560(+)|eukprot:CAMPEP_0118880928 /NCGR_PEP_ID=MMETSP1163-20130328/20455_1 /TAXON_ID=124430 /ORGANISM="Phaeomonas parva, Strain CCMP2877" /LENGTH=125 /DNA_ID=CAMNT_0006817529 /DNA_START=113 /DNA_END=490 /DNA_ORIENTATION=+
MKVLSVVALLALLVAPAAAFAPARKAPRAMRSSLKMEQTEAPTYWEGKVPPSTVLGPVLSKTPSGLLGPVSIISLLAGTYSVHESNILHTLNADTVYPVFVIGSLLVPISWGLHVAAWINKENGN